MNSNEIAIINEENIKGKIYEIRGQKVMLDFDLAEIYGYTTSSFNQQVKRNVDKFDEDFRFQLTGEELKDLVMSQFVISRNNIYQGQEGGTRKLPYAFTEQGVYMLMTVLKGDLATKQSKALIRLFKSMKDYIVESNNLVTTNEILRLSRQVHQNTDDIKEMGNRLDTVIDCFSDVSKQKQFIFLDGERIEADMAFECIYTLAKRSILIIDDYISIKTLQHLKVCSRQVKITMISDNQSKNRITNGDLNDFVLDTGLEIKMIPSYGKYHDRFIVIDYKTNNEKVYLSGSSSKDAGNKITAIIRIEEKEAFHQIFDKALLNN